MNVTAVEPEQVQETGNIGSTTIDQVKILKERLETECCESSTPVDFWEFLLDPESFPKTVENIFYFSFLIKDGLAKLGRNGRIGEYLPENIMFFLESSDMPTDRDFVEKRARQKQMVVSLTYWDWEVRFKITVVHVLEIGDRTKSKKTNSRRID